MARLKCDVSAVSLVGRGGVSWVDVVLVVGNDLIDVEGWGVVGESTPF